jgi:O2-independent ubiquinone biosynthesis protein UbiV
MDMKLTLGPLMFHWPAEQWQQFYAGIADNAPVDRVVIGELVCSKRLPFYEALIPEMIERLQAAGKEVVLASLALPTLVRERKILAGLGETGLPVEVNDLTMLAHLNDDHPFTLGPLVNTYNRGTLEWLAARGATSVCLPPELPLSSVTVLARTAAALNVACEVWGYGRLPLAMSGRCYHARLARRSKDGCQFVCEDDPDGRAVDTLDGKKFMAVNGVQTLSGSWANMVGDIAALKRAGVTALRLSPHTGDMAKVAQIFRDAADGTLSPEEAIRSLQQDQPGRRFSNGFLFAEAGADWSHGRA